MRVLKIFTLFLSALTLFSCVKDVDFEQAESLSFSPILESSLVNFERTAPQFYKGNEREEVIAIQDELELDLFNGDFMVDNLTEANLFFEFENTIEKPFNILIEFVDENDSHQHTIEFQIEAFEGGDAIVKEYLEVFKDNNLPALKQTAKLKMTFSLLKGKGMIEESGIFKMKSKATFYFHIETAE